MDIRRISAHGYTALINLSRGANCVSLTHEQSSANILREPCYDHELDNPFLYGMPILFPQNRISGGEFEFEGRRYRFPINEEKTGCHLHGILHSLPFTLDKISDNSISVYYCAKSGEYLGFPHDFRISMSYTLTDDGLVHKTVVENLSDTAMPCFLGFHTTFNASPFGNAPTRVLVDVKKEYERNMECYLPTGVCPPPDDVTRALTDGSFDPYSKPISRHYRSGGEMRIEIRSDKYTVVYENSKNMPFRLIYNGDASGYICLEPQTNLADAPNAPFDRAETGFFAIAAHSGECFESKIKVINTKGVRTNENHKA